MSCFSPDIAKDWNNSKKLSPANHSFPSVDPQCTIITLPATSRAQFGTENQPRNKIVPHHREKYPPKLSSSAKKFTISDKRGSWRTPPSSYGYVQPPPPFHAIIRNNCRKNLFQRTTHLLLPPWLNVHPHLKFQFPKCHNQQRHHHHHHL